jgi:phosphoheptose isomerase
VIAMSGMGGGELAPAADVAVTVPSDDMELVEDAHMTLAHTMVRAVRHHFAGRR